ncbi:aldo/keto reductase [uncultured Parabacteroides sp.]|uniref:aldo/keto reductase n=1 Tax=uncultured Parabacteroides sp. TaxID=512312 RepID=UPI00260FBA88|nr:aldo/keto reductase [uncultured Parabacteroides sp.]
MNISREQLIDRKLSRIGLGGMRMGNLSEGVKTIHKALDNDINFLNTADFYGSGENEMLIREALRNRKREDVFISVKFGAMMGIDGRLYGIDVRPQAVENYLHYTLKRLGTDYVDLYQPARINPHIPVEDTIGAVADLVGKGYVRNIGISEVDGATLRRANAVHPISLVEVRYSLMDRHIEDDLLPAARELGIGVVAFGVLLAGLIGGSAREEKLSMINKRVSSQAFNAISTNLSATDKLQEIAEEKGVSLAQLAIAWVLAQGEDIMALVGSRTPEQVESTLRSLDILLSSEDLDRISNIIPKERATSSYMLEMNIDENGLFRI